MAQHTQADTKPSELPSTPEMEVWEFEDDIGFPIFLWLLGILLVAGSIFCIMEAVIRVLG